MILFVFDKCIVCRIAMFDQEYPYIVPVNFGYEIDERDMILYFHGAMQGRKNELIRLNNKVSFEMDCSLQVLMPIGEKACTTSMSYESVIGQGEVFVVSDDKKEEALSLILKHHKVDAKHFNPIHLSNTIVYGIRCSKYTAKRNG